MKLQQLPPEGLWISPEGDRIPVVEHMIALQQFPHLFGLLERHVKGKPIEHLATIAADLVRKGWTRFRNFGYVYAFEVDRISMRWGLVESILSDGNALLEEKVSISQAFPRSRADGTVSEVYERTLIFRKENPRRHGLGHWRFT